MTYVVDHANVIVCTNTVANDRYLRHANFAQAPRFSTVAPERAVWSNRTWRRTPPDFGEQPAIG